LDEIPSGLGVLPGCEDAAGLQDELVNAQWHQPADPSEVCAAVVELSAQISSQAGEAVVDEAESHKAEDDQVGTNLPFFVKADQAAEGWRHRQCR